MNCPVCNTSGAYIGLSKVECRNTACRHHVKPELQMFEIHVVYDDDMPLLESNDMFPDDSCGDIEDFQEELSQCGDGNQCRLLELNWAPPARNWC